MDILGLSASSRTLPSAAERPSAATKIERLTEAANQLRQATQTAAEAEKARAKERLEHAKRILAMLKRWGFPAEVIAQRAAELAREVGAAAQQFAAALNAGGAAISAGDADSSLDATVAAEDGMADAGDEDGGYVRRAYREAMELRPERQQVSREDRATIEEFRVLAQQIKALLERAEAEARRKRSSPDSVADASGPAPLTDPR